LVDAGDQARTGLAGLTWEEAAHRAADSVLAVPLGSTEQHGPHLPLSVDTDIAVRLAEDLAERRPDILVAPSVPYGSSGEHAGFVGTLSIGQSALEHLIVELVRSADAFAGVVLVSGHGGNASTLRRAVDTLRGEGRRVMAWMPAPPRCAPVPADSHAGYVETSVMWAMRPSAVRGQRMAPGATGPLTQMIGDLVRSGVVSVSQNGVLGDPSGSSAVAGKRILAEWADDLAAALDGWP
jgi:mycofactocin precursor peptide peptidase